MKKIAVVGSINMDFVVAADRIPQKGETIHGHSLQYLPGGKGANQAVAAARLGGQVEMFGCVGQDSTGQTLLDNLAAAGVDTRHVQVVAGVPTGTAFITLGNNDNSIVIVAGANDCVTRGYIDQVKEALLAADIILLQHEIPQDTNEYVVELAARAGKTVVLNPAPARTVSPELVERIAYLTPNEHEAAILFGRDRTIRQLLEQHPEKLIVTQGEQGVGVCTREQGVVQIPAAKVTVVDTTGAGDTLNGAFAFMLARGAGVVEALQFANRAAGCSIQKMGAQGGMPTYQQVMELQ